MKMIANYSELITDKDTFSFLKGECEKIIDTRKRLPDFIFRHSFSKYFAIEHAQIQKNEFGSFLFKMAEAFHDESVNYMTIEPDPVDYYYRNCSFLGLASFKPAEVAGRYRSVMSRDGNVDSFLARGGDVGVFWGSSLKWGIFCDRISWELAVIAISGDIDIPTISGFRCMDALWLSKYLQSQYPDNPAVALGFAQRFSTNYAI